ncbi:MAG: Nucleoid-associated protein YbaB [Proteobacteria bacterium]|nr:Nucleoid-associated protein YbaB [Pseudomonadota bacterium]
MFGDIGKMMKEAQQLQARMAEAQEEIAKIEATGTSGGGLVSVTVTGKGGMKGLRIDPSLLKPEEAEILEDLIVAAFTDARAHVDSLVAERMQAVTGNLPLPPGFKLPF